MRTSTAVGAVEGAQVPLVSRSEDRFLLEDDNAEIQSDFLEDCVDSELNANCISELEALLKVIEGDMEVLDLEYATLVSSLPEPRETIPDAAMNGASY